MVEDQVLARVAVPAEDWLAPTEKLVRVSADLEAHSPMEV